jgi:hypothetical protein
MNNGFLDFSANGVFLKAAQTNGGKHRWLKRRRSVAAASCAQIDALEPRILFSSYWTMNTLALMQDYPNGFQPSSGMAVDGSGDVYSETWGGATGAYGSIYGLSEGSDVPATIAYFTAGNGSIPSGGLIRDTAGNLFGTTRLGGGN